MKNNVKKDYMKKGFKMRGRVLGDVGEDVIKNGNIKKWYEERWSVL